MNYDVVLNANDNAILETQYAFTQGDYGQIQFSIRVKADGQYIANASRAYILFTLSNGMIVTGADMPKNVVTYTYVFQGNELQSPGKVVADVKLVYANGQISSNKFTFLCRFDPLADKSVPAAPYITVLQRIVDEGQEKIDYLQTLIDSIQGSIGETAITRNDLQSTRDPVTAGLKALDAHLAQYMMLKSDLVNNGLTTVEGFALDARYGKNLQDQITTVNSNLQNYVYYADVTYENFSVPANSFSIIGTLPSEIQYNKILSHSVVGGNSLRGMAEVSIEVDRKVYLYASGDMPSNNKIIIRILCKK
jgi:hypothetical protein